MARRAPERGAIGDFHDAAEIDHRNAVGDAAHQRQVVRDEQQREPQFTLKFAEQVDHLRAHRHVERRDRLVADQELRPQRERARDDDALALSPGEFVRKTVEHAGIEPDAQGKPHGLGAALGSRPAGDAQRQRDRRRRRSGAD